MVLLSVKKPSKQMYSLAKWIHPIWSTNKYVSKNLLYRPSSMDCVHYLILVINNNFTDGEKSYPGKYRSQWVWEEKPRPSEFGFQPTRPAILRTFSRCCRCKLSYTSLLIFPSTECRLWQSGHPPGTKYKYFAAGKNGKCVKHKNNQTIL